MLRPIPLAVRMLSCEPLLGPLPSLDLTDIEWVIVGGESGPNARPCDPDWVRDIRDRCVEQALPSSLNNGEVVPRKRTGDYLTVASGISSPACGREAHEPVFVLFHEKERA